MALNRIRIFGIVWVIGWSIAAAILTWVLRRNLLDGCALPQDIGRYGTDGVFVLYIRWPFTLAGVLVLMGGTYAALTWRPTGFAYAAPLISLAPCLLWMWVMTAWSYGSVDENICPMGHPAWWPSWIPI